MLSSLDPSAQQFLNDLGRVSDRMSRAQREISSGQKVGIVSDSPDQISTLLLARASLASQQQIQTNLGRVKTETDTAEQSLQSAVTQLDQVQTLGAQGASSIETAQQRIDLAQQVGNVLTQLVGLAGSKVEGRFIFAGDSDSVSPFTIDLTQANPVSAYQGSPATRLIQHPNGTPFPVAPPAEHIFAAVYPAHHDFNSLTQLPHAPLV